MNDVKGYSYDLTKFYILKHNMLLQTLNIHLIDFLFILPEICLLSSILHCLYQLAKGDTQAASSKLVSTKQIYLSHVVFKTTYIYVQFALLILSSFLIIISLSSWIIPETYERPDWINFFGFNYQMSFDLYSIFFKFILFFSVKIILSASARYFLSKKTVPIEFPILIQLFLFFVSVLVSANDLIIAFIAIIGFSLAVYVLILTEFSTHKSREAAMKYFYLSALSSGFIGFGI